METTATAPEGMVWAPCSRCSGKGHIRGFEGIAGGVCFGCGGTGGEHVAAKVLARRQSAAQRRAAKRVADREARLVQLNVDRRTWGWTWADLRDCCGLDSDADSMLVDLWEGHEDHPNFPGWNRPDGSSVK